MQSKEVPFFLCQRGLLKNWKKLERKAEERGIISTISQDTEIGVRFQRLQVLSMAVRKRDYGT